MKKKLSRGEKAKLRKKLQRLALLQEPLEIVNARIATLVILAKNQKPRI